MIGLEIAVLVCLAFWIGLALDRSRAWPREATLPKLDKLGGSRESGSVWALVPARNEELALARTLFSLLNQDSIDLVVVADDNSGDATRDVVGGMAQVAERGASLRLVVVPTPPSGWSGKVHAIAHATAQLMEADSDTGALGPDWWLFSDADIEQDPDTVRALLKRAESEEQGGPFDLVSVMARLHAECFWERVLIPPFVFFFQLLYPFRRVMDWKSPVAAAAGGCVLVRRSVYDRVGRHAAIWDALIDDVELAKLIKGGGGRVWLGLDENVHSVRSYQRLGDLWRMVARSAFVQLRYRVDLLALVILGMAVVVVAPPLLLGAAGVEIATGSQPTAAGVRIIAWASLAWLLQARALLPSIRHHRVPAAYGLTLPLAGALYAFMTVSSAWSHLSGRGQRWKGRSYPSPGSEEPG